MGPLLLTLLFFLSRSSVDAEPGVVLFFPNMEEMILTTKNQTIGPWHLNAEGSYAWKDYFSFSSGYGHAVKLRRSGVFTIFAQVFYQDSSLLGSHDTDYLGYQIKTQDAKRTAVLADCVTPRLRDGSFCTCSTQVTRFLNGGEQIYLENIHFSPNNRSAINNFKNSETFFGVVKL